MRKWRNEEAKTAWTRKAGAHEDNRRALHEGACFWCGARTKGPGYPVCEECVSENG